MAGDDALAAQLRELATTLHTTAADVGRREHAAELLAQANELLSIGERRVRWHEIVDGRRARSRDLSPWSGAVNAAAPPMFIEPGERNGEPCMLGRVRLSRLREGPALGVHGGVVAGLFDEILAAGQSLAGSPAGVTGRLIVRYRQITPIDTDLVFRSWVVRDRGLRLDMRAECGPAAGLEHEQADDGTFERTADAEAFFVRRRR
ncbi:MAG: hotdog fold domain-containing protein [Actinomycetota bacterium]